MQEKIWHGERRQRMKKKIKDQEFISTFKPIFLNNSKMKFQIDDLRNYLHCTANNKTSFWVMVCTYIFSLFNVNYTSITLYIVNIQETNYDVFYSNLLILENLLQNKYFHSHFSDGYYHNCVARCNFLLFHADVYQFAYMNYEMNLRKMTSFIYIII